MSEDKCMISYKKYIENFASNISNSIILDIGCGNGNYTEIFCKNDNIVHGVDINDFRFETIKNKFYFKLYNGKELPYENNYFDCIVSFDVIEHVEDDNNFVKEIFRVIKKDDKNNILGKILIATPNKYRLSNRLYKLIGKPIIYPLIISDNGQLGKLIHIREYTKEELNKLFLNNGFSNYIIENYWFGLRGKINVGINKFFIKNISQYLFLRK